MPEQLPRHSGGDERSRSDAYGRLTRSAKPMQALRVLAAADRPLHETDIWQRTAGNRLWHAPLKQLVDRGLAKRTGTRGGYRYTITDLGREEVERRV